MVADKINFKDLGTKRYWLMSCRWMTFSAMES